jgi:hypothetical protein
MLIATIVFALLQWITSESGKGPEIKPSTAPLQIITFCDLREEAGHNNDRYHLELSSDGKNWLPSGVPKRCTPVLLYGDESAKIADMVQFVLPAGRFARIVRE